LTTGFRLGRATVVDLLERPLSEIDAGELSVTLRPFQILTLRLTPG
jgi:alpha-mannosidase